MGLSVLTMTRSRPRRRRARRWHFVWLCVYVFLLSLSIGTFAAEPNGAGGAGEAETSVVEEPVAVQRRQPITVELGQPLTVEVELPPLVHVPRASVVGHRAVSPGASYSLRSPPSVTSPSKGGSRRTPPHGRSSGNTPSPPTARNLLKALRRRLGGGDSTIQVQTLQNWLEEKLLEGRTPRAELMKAVIAATGEGLRFADKAVPSTRTDLLRRTATQLSIGPSELRQLAQEVKGDPSLVTRHSDAGESPPQPGSQKETRVYERMEYRIPSPVSQVSTPASVSPEPLDIPELPSGPETPDVPEPVEAFGERAVAPERDEPVEERVESAEPVDTPKLPDTRKRLTLDLSPPTSEGRTSDGAEGSPDVEEAFDLPQSNWLSELEELLRAPTPPTPSPLDEETAPSFSFETQKLLASIPPLPGKPIPESTKELLEYSPYMGVAPRWASSVEEESMGSIGSLLLPHGAQDEKLDSISRQVDDIIAELQAPSEAEMIPVNDDISTAPNYEEEPTVEGVGARSPDGGEAPAEDKLSRWVGGEAAESKEASPEGKGPLTVERLQRPLGLSGEAARTETPKPDKSEASSMQPALSSSSSEEVMMEQSPHMAVPVIAPGRGHDGRRPGVVSSSTDFEEKRPKLWERTKAAVNEHKTMLKVTGGMLVGALLVGGLALFYKRLRRRIPSSSPLISKVEERKCRVLVDFSKGKKLKGMGKVARIESVRVNNTKRTLTLEYLERPALKCSRGREFFKWLKYYASLGQSLVRRVESMPFPESCMAGPFSRFQVAEDNDGSASRLLVDLDLNPGPLAVPRELMDGEQLDELLEDYEEDPVWKLYGDCVMHITVNSSFSGSPMVAVDTARGRVGFLNPELKHLSSPLPRECDWREPSTLRIAYKSTTNGGPVDLLLMMSRADPPLEETIVLERESGDAVLDEPDDVLEGIRTLFGE